HRGSPSTGTGPCRRPWPPSDYWRWRRGGYTAQHSRGPVPVRRKAAWRRPPLRQEKSWKGEWKRNLKPFEAIQRVRPPPGTRGFALLIAASSRIGRVGDHDGLRRTVPCHVAW